MLPAAEEIVLHRLTLRGAAEDIGVARKSLRAALEQSVWPSTAPGELLFLRRISARGNPREIAARSAVQAHRLAADAVDGWSLAAPDALAVHFRGSDSMLACLIRDLLQGAAPRCWYWRRWHKTIQQPDGAAIVALLHEAPMQMPAVIARLHATPVWHGFWQALGQSGAERLLMLAGQATGWGAALHTARAPDGVSAEAASVATAGVAPLYDLAFLSASADDPRLLLAALLTLWQKSPALINKSAGAAEMRRLSRTIAGASAGLDSGCSRETRPEGGMREVASEQAAQPEAGKKFHAVQQVNGGAEEAQHRAAPRKPIPAMPGRTGKRSAGETPSSTQVPSLLYATDRTAGNQPAVPERATLHKDAPQPAMTEAGNVLREPHVPAASGEGFITPQGGVFYLLNFINRSGARLRQLPDMPGAGWRWLYDIARALGCAPEGELLEFLARECGMEKGALLAQQPPVAPLDHLMRLGTARYGEAVWHSETWRIPARLVANPGHLDLHFRLNDASLAVRRAGLDINPGWLPWLGRVVTFHYGSGLEPAK